MPTSTVWHLEPHTLGKHKVLRGYLDAWYPIMAKWNGRILFIDGFAGPGEYVGGEPGSPIIAIEAFLEHDARKRFNAEVGFIFIEKDKARAQHLESLVANKRSSLPQSSWATVDHSRFDETMTDVLDQVDAQATNLAPSLVMVDPFGVSETPMSVIHRILQSPKSEVYVSFQYEAINRFRDTLEFEEHLDTLFGSEEWRQGVDIQEPNDRKSFFYGLYEEQLRVAGAEQVLHFELYEGARLVYAIFFASKHVLGSDRMKKAIWNVAPWGDFAFRPPTTPQLSLGIATPDFIPLQQQLLSEFAGKGRVSIQEVTTFAMSDRIPYHSGQLRQGGLIPLEEQGKLDVDETTRSRRNTYPEGTMMMFR